MSWEIADRTEGRYPGQGSFLEDEAGDWLRTRDRWVTTRVSFWGAEVDLVARRDDDGWPRRLLGECKDWWGKPVTPCTLWRLIALAMTARAEPILVHNHRAELTDRAQRIAEKWRVRTVTDEEVLDGVPLPEPQRPRYRDNNGFPPILNDDIEYPHGHAPDYYGWFEREMASDRLDVL